MRQMSSSDILYSEWACMTELSVRWRFRGISWENNLRLPELNDRCAPSGHIL